MSSFSFLGDRVLTEVEIEREQGEKGVSSAPRPSADVSIRTATPDETLHWDEIVAGFDNCRVFHKRGWIRSLEELSGSRALYLIFTKNDEIIGCLPGFLVKVGFLRLFCSPREGWQTESMGPVFDEELVSTEELFQALIPFLESRHGIQHIELASHCLDPVQMSRLGFGRRPLPTYRVPLHPGDEERTMTAINSKTRNQLRKAVKLGLSVMMETEESFVTEFYDQLREVFTRRGKAVPFGSDRALRLFRNMKESGNLLAVSVSMPNGGPCIATGIFLIDGREVILWGWTHRTQYRWYCPTELLTWTAMKEAMNRGCMSLDMSGGGAGKEKFGAALEQTNSRWIRSRYRWLAWLRESARRAYRTQQSVRGWWRRRIASTGKARPADHEGHGGQATDR